MCGLTLEQLEQKRQFYTTDGHHETRGKHAELAIIVVNHGRPPSGSCVLVLKKKNHTGGTYFFLKKLALALVASIKNLTHWFIGMVACRLQFTI